MAYAVKTKCVSREEYEDEKARLNKTHSIIKIIDLGENTFKILTASTMRSLSVFKIREDL